ncbi:MAG: exonuclease SbcCD subunit D [Bacilli bacterium]|nr:exonuclease SbcCD subunit D [Bacilli bacterium]
MKIMHLADLHLGKSILEQSLINDQIYILNQIVDIIVDKKIDVVLIAGDVYDKAIPNVEAVRLFSSFLARLYELKVKVLVISGNHDSKDRLSFGSELFIDNGVYIEGTFSGNLKCVELEDEYGKVLIYMLPFVKPADVRKYYPDVSIDDYQDAIKCIIDNANIDKTKRNIIMVHQFVTANGIDIERSDSESISLGGIDNIDVSLFDKFDYVAMGHIHRGQRLTKDTVRYAGSPLKYSFSEVNHKKSVPIIELNEKGNVKIELVDLVPIRDMIAIKGKLEELLDKEFVDKINVNDYVSAVITDEDYIMDAIGKLRSVYKNILRLEYDNKRTNNYLDNDKSKDIDIKQISEIDLFSEFYKMQNNIELDNERKKILNEIITSIKD